MCRLFGASALLMTMATTLLAWLYGVVNGKELVKKEALRNGNVTKNARSGNVKGE